MNIVDFLKDTIDEPCFFRNRISMPIYGMNMKALTSQFLLSTDERQREYLAKTIIRYALEPHAKGKEVGAVNDILNMFELCEHPDYKKNRKHLVHQVNTFLLGLLFYNKVEKLWELINKEMTDTTKRLSGGDVQGEFLFRWRLGSLAHDCGNSISLFWRHPKKFRKLACHIYLVHDEVWHDDEDLLGYLLSLRNGKETLSLLDILDGQNRISQFYEYLNEHLYRRSIRYDHGIMSALMLLKILDEMYYRSEGETIIYKYGRVSFDREYFNESIVRAAYAIAIHNVDFYPKVYKILWGNEKIYDATKSPFAFLLKICDLLQEWYKPKVNEEKDYIRPHEVQLNITPNKIIVEKFPKKPKLKKRIDRYIESDGLIEV